MTDSALQRLLYGTPLLHRAMDGSFWLFWRIGPPDALLCDACGAVCAEGWTTGWLSTDRTVCRACFWADRG